jgi:hypothetical protein
MLTQSAAQPQLSSNLTQLPPQIASRLAAEGIADLETWRQLSHRRRRSIFGVTRAMVAQIDKLAWTAP